MNKTFYSNNRNNYLESVDDNSITVLFSGGLVQWTADQNYRFEVNKNFYYLTGINQEKSILILIKGKEIKEHLFIIKNDDLKTKWDGKKLTIEAAREISGIENISYLDAFDDSLFSYLNSGRQVQENLTKIYLDLERRDHKEYTTKALAFSKTIKKYYPELNIDNAYYTIIALRMIKAPEEVEKIKESIETTKLALENVMRNIKPNLYEYQIETYFDSAIKYLGNKDIAFSTICAAGKNATILHYVDNNQIAKDGDLILFDLGCRTDYYVSDISRTYPVNGKFTSRQKEVYQVVLEVNKQCIKFLKPGITWNEYNQFANKLLIEGLKKLKKIEKDDELRKYYWHSIGHNIGLDTHDPVLRNTPLQEGMVLTVEPGLYLEDEKIGIRIEDNILITKDGTVNLSKDIVKEIEEIENMMY